MFAAPRLLGQTMPIQSAGVSRSGNRIIPRWLPNYNYLCTCDLYTPVHNVLEAWIYITWGSWRGWALEFTSFLGPVKNGIEPIGECHLGPKKLGNFPAQPLQLPQVMYIHASKTLCTGLYKSQVHRLFYAHEGGLGPHTQDDPAGCVCGGRGGRGGSL
jgi:hypothetical protein